MPVISFVNDKKPKFEVAAGSNLMFSLLERDIPVASSCHGEGVCSKCRIQIIQGADKLSKPNERELFLAQQNNLKANERISCQTLVLGDITIHTGYW